MEFGALPVFAEQSRKKIEIQLNSWPVQFSLQLLHLKYYSSNWRAMFMPYQPHPLLMSRDFKLIHAFNLLFYSSCRLKKETPRSKARTNNKLDPYMALGEKTKCNGIDDSLRNQEVSYFAAINLSNIVTG